MNNITTIKGSQPGSTTIIMGGVHGDEPTGIKVIKLLKDTLQIDKGVVYLILANPKACEKNKRYIDHNMNRCFNGQTTRQGYEIDRVQEIIPYLKKSNHLLDIHNTERKNTEPFLITEHLQYSNIFPVRKIITNIDSFEPGGSDGYMDSLGKIGICLEAGSIYGEVSLEKIIKSVRFFLRKTGNINKKRKLPQVEHQQTYIKTSYKYIAKTKNCTLVKGYSDFEKVKKGQLLGYDESSKITSPYDAVIFFAHQNNKQGDEVFCLGIPFTQ